MGGILLRVTDDSVLVSTRLWSFRLFLCALQYTCFQVSSSIGIGVDCVWDLELSTLVVNFLAFLVFYFVSKYFLRRYMF